MDRRICDFLRQNGRSKALIIARAVKRDKSTVNRHLYSLQKSNQVFRTTENPPLWELIEKKSDFEPEQKSQMSKDMCEEKHLIESSVPDGRQVSNSMLSELFEMISKIAEGGYGCIYKVKHKLDGKIYALKQVNLTGNAESEVKALAGLDHLNIVRYITSWLGPANWASNQERNTLGSHQEARDDDDDNDDEDDDADNDDDDDDDEDEDNNTSGMESLRVTTDSRKYLFIQMEFCVGGTLTDWIQVRNHMEKQRTTLEIHKIFSEIITGVEFIHANKFIHRDLKPDNILFGADGKVKIGDFGLVAAQTDQNGDPIERSKRKGTPPYMSPEQENKKNYDEKTDIFPLGLIWFEMLWKISTGMERVKLWSDLRNQRFPEGFSDKYSAESTFIMKMLSYSPEDRPHAKDIKRDLQTFFSLEHDVLSQKTI